MSLGAIPSSSATTSSSSTQMTVVSVIAVKAVTRNCLKMPISSSVGVVVLEAAIFLVFIINIFPLVDASMDTRTGSNFDQPYWKQGSAALQNNSSSTDPIGSSTKLLKQLRIRKRGHRQECESTLLSGSTSTNSTTHCAPIYVCFNTTCRCPLGQAYQMSDSKPQCVKFSEFQCQNNTQCQDTDTNVVCVKNKCKCKAGFSVESANGFCQKSYENLRIKSQGFSMRKIYDRTQISSTVPTPSEGQFFKYRSECRTNSQCAGEFTYCLRGGCQCRPEFEFRPANLSLSLNTSSDTTEMDVWVANSTTAEAEYLDFGYCGRKICQKDYQCQTEDNPHLVCNTSICECRFSYTMSKDMICTKYIVRRQSCDLTCKIIGGLFATIFLITLIYWCLYCCYSIVKNYQLHRQQQSRCHDAAYLRNMYEFEPINYERYLSANSLTRNSRSPISSRFPVNLTTFLRIPLNDDPPSYTQAMADEMLPDYEAVMELRELRKAES